MKQGIHPEYGATDITCMSCGNVIQTKSTGKNLKIDKCSECAYKKQQNLGMRGQVGRFKSKYKLD